MMCIRKVGMLKPSYLHNMYIQGGLGLRLFASKQATGSSGFTVAIVKCHVMAVKVPPYFISVQFYFLQATLFIPTLDTTTKFVKTTI